MKFEKVTLHNFLSHKDLEVVFEDGLHLIYGKNGAGKSAILSAVEWVLFGKVSRDQTSKELIREGESSAIVELVLTLGGKEILVTRTVSNSKSGLQVSVDGADVTQSTIRETQAKLESIIGLDHRGFCAVALYAQGASSIAAMSDAEKKVVLERVLGFERLREAKALAKDKLDMRKGEVKDLTLQRQLNVTRLDDNLEHRDDLNKRKKEILAQREQTRKALLEELQDLEEPVWDTPLDLEQAQLKRDIDDLIHVDDEITRINAAVSDMRVEVARLTFCIDSATHELHGLATEEISNFDPQTQRCPTCEQVINDGGKWMELKAAQVQAEKDRDARIQVIKDKADGFKNKRSVLQKQIAVKTEERAAYEDQVKKLQELQQAVSIIQAKRVTLMRDKEYYGKRKSSILKQLVETDNLSVSGFDEDIAKVSKTISTLESDILGIDKRIKSIQEELPYYEFWVKAFGRGLQTLIIDTALPYLNKRANLYLTEMTGGTATVEISAQSHTQAGEARDKISIEATYAGGPSSYGGKSGGERRRVDLAITLAMGDLVAARYSEPVMWRALDEALGPLDPEGCELIVAMLEKHVLPSVSTILMISHQENIQDKFDSVIHITKHNGISKVKDGG